MANGPFDLSSSDTLKEDESGKAGMGTEAHLPKLRMPFL